MAESVQTGSTTGTRSTSDTLTLTATDNGGSGVKSVEIYDGASDLGAATKQADGSWTYTANALSEGTHDFTAKATDNAGNESNPSAIVSDLVDKSNPIAIVSQTASSTDWNKVTTNTITVSALDALSGVDTITVTKDSGAPFAYTGAQITGLTDGTHTFTVNVTDKAGKVTSQVLTDRVDTTLPTATITQTSADTITVTAGDALSGLKSVTLTEDGNAVQLQKSGGNYVFSTAGLSGPHSFVATAIDNAGNSKITAALDYKVDAELPVISSFTGSASGWQLQERNPHGNGDQGQ